MHRITPYNYSYLRIAIFSLFVGVFTIAASLCVDWALHGRGILETWVIFGTARSIYASDVLSAVTAATASAIAMTRLQKRQRDLLRRMQAVEDVNHHVRNALTAVMLSSVLRSDPELDERVRDASQRIDWALRDVLPGALTGNVDRSPAKWAPGRKLNEKTN